MKKSEFLNKAVEELTEILNDLISMPEAESDNEQLEFVKMLITDKSLLKAAAMTASDRFELLGMVESLRAIAAFAKENGEEQLKDETVLFTLCTEAMQKAEKRSYELEENFEDDLEEDEEITLMSAADVLLNAINENPQTMSKIVGSEKEMNELADMLNELEEDENDLN